MILFALLILFAIAAIGAFIYGLNHGDSCAKQPPHEPIKEDTGEFTQEELDYWYQQNEEETSD